MQAVILAAGESSRSWPLNYQHKSLIKMMGKPLIWYTIDGLQKAGIKEIIVVQNQKREVEKELKEYFPSIKYAIQKKPTGMGNAILEAESYLGKNFFILNAERVDCLEYITQILKKFREEKTASVLLASRTKTPWLFGILKIEENRVLEIVEKPRKGREPSNLKVVGIYLISKNIVPYLKKFQKRENSLEKSISFLAKKERIELLILKKELPPLKYPWHLFGIKNFLLEKYLSFGISDSAQIARSCQIEGKVFINVDCKIFENVVIKGPCYIGKNCIIGNNALIREKSVIEDDCIIGANAEIKNCIFQENVHCHSGYFGDSIFGRNCRVGAGIITANVRLDRQKVKSFVKGEKIETGLKRLGAIVGENTSFGINCSSMPGVLIGSNCFIGPKSLVKANIEDNIFFYAKFKEVKKKKI